MRWAEWTEISRGGRVWIIPARRIKAARQHRVPLWARALEILDAAQTLGEGTGTLVFTRGGGRPLHYSAVRRLLREFGVVAVPHGFRSTFRDWEGEETDHPWEVIEAALAHVVGNRSTLTTTEPDPTLAPLSTTPPPHRVSQAAITSGDPVRYGSSGEGRGATTPKPTGFRLRSAGQASTCSRFLGSSAYSHPASRHWTAVSVGRRAHPA